MLEALEFLDDAATRLAVTAERAALKELGGGCQVPIGVHCRPVGAGLAGAFEIFGVVADPTGSRMVEAKAMGNGGEGLGVKVAEILLERGAQDVLASVAAQ